MEYKIYYMIRLPIWTTFKYTHTHIFEFTLQKFYRHHLRKRVYTIYILYVMYACNLRDFNTFTHSFPNNNLIISERRANWISYLLNIPTCNIILNFNIFISFVRLIASGLPVLACPLIPAPVVLGNYKLHVQIKNSWNICYQRRRRRLHLNKLQDHGYKYNNTTMQAMNKEKPYDSLIWLRLRPRCRRRRRSCGLHLNSWCMYKWVLSMLSIRTHTLTHQIPDCHRIQQSFYEH